MFSAKVLPLKGADVAQRRQILYLHTHDYSKQRDRIAAAHVSSWPRIAGAGEKTPRLK